MDKLKITRVTRRRNEENSLAISYELNGKQHAYLVNPKTIIEHLIKRQDPTRIEVDRERLEEIILKLHSGNTFYPGSHHSNPHSVVKEIVTYLTKEDSDE